MDEYYYYNAATKPRTHVPAFGGWDYTGDGLPFTECFESAMRNHHHHHYPSTDYNRSYDAVYGGKYGAGEEERDLYVAGDLYQNDVVTPAVIVVPRRRRTKGGGGGYPQAKKQHKRRQQEDEWGGGGYEIKQPPSPLNSPPQPPQPPTRAARSTAKAVDEDLYKIPSHLLHSTPMKSKKKKRGFGMFSSCLLPCGA